MRRLPRTMNLKCLTALVTYIVRRSTPASASARSNSCPAGPTNGLPARSSWSPGCSPTTTMRASPAAFAEHGLRRGFPQRARAAVAAPRAARSTAGRSGSIVEVDGRSVMASVDRKVGSAVARGVHHALGARRRGQRRGVDHRVHAMARGGRERRDQLGFGQVLPVLLRHLPLHRRELQTRGIEDVRVVAAPEVLEHVAVGRVASDGRRARSSAWSPSHDALRSGRQDRPAHRREAPREERRRPPRRCSATARTTRRTTARCASLASPLRTARSTWPGRRRVPAASTTATSRKRTYAFILCRSRRIALTIASSRTMSGSTAISISPGSRRRRHSTR